MLEGILTRRDMRCAKNDHALVESIMTPREKIHVMELKSLSGMPSPLNFI